MSSQSPRLGLGYVLPSQAQKHVTVNESLRRLDALVHCAVLSATLAAEPAAPQEGDAYILPAGRAGPAWSVMPAGHVAAFQDGAFAAIAPAPGLVAFVRDAAAFTLFDGAAWRALPFGPGAPALLGVNTEADAVNRLAVKADAELLSHDDVTPGSGDARKIVNKAAAGRTASLLFQSGFSGRAEIGLIGDDALTVKVSADGETFAEVLRAAPASGHVGIGGVAAPACALDVAGPVRVAGYAVAELPAAAAGAGQIVLVTDEAGGAVPAFSDGVAWRRVTDRAVVS